MNKSEQIGKLAAALAKAQAEMKGALKDSSNPFFKSRYADLESVWDACKDALNKNELSVVQTFGFGTDSAGSGMDLLITTLLHSSGEWISGQQRLLYKDATAQGLGAASTYARRFGLAAICGVVQTDDDGNDISGRGQQPAKPQSIARGPTSAPHPGRDPGRDWKS